MFTHLGKFYIPFPYFTPNHWISSNYWACESFFQNCLPWKFQQRETHQHQTPNVNDIWYSVSTPQKFQKRPKKSKAFHKKNGCHLPLLFREPTVASFARWKIDTKNKNKQKKIPADWPTWTWVHYVGVSFWTCVTWREKIREKNRPGCGGTSQIFEGENFLAVYGGKATPPPCGLEW